MCVALLTSDVVSWKTTMLEQTKVIECMCMSCMLESYMNVVHLFFCVGIHPLLHRNLMFVGFPLFCTVGTTGTTPPVSVAEVHDQWDQACFSAHWYNMDGVGSSDNMLAQMVMHIGSDPIPQTYMYSNFGGDCLNSIKQCMYVLYLHPLQLALLV